MKPTYLYIKTHKTGLKYFGKTIKDPFVYKGSGVVWLRHIKKHGNDVSTEVLNNGLPFITPETLSEAALKFSKDNNIVKSTEWANLMDEDGLTGGDFTQGYSESEYKKLCEQNRRVKTPETIEKQRVASIISQNRPDVKMKKSLNGKIAQNKPEQKQLLKDKANQSIKDGTHPSQMTWTCQCGVSGKGKSNFNRYHKNCAKKV